MWDSVFVCHKFQQRFILVFYTEESVTLIIFKYKRFAQSRFKKSICKLKELHLFSSLLSLNCKLAKIG